MNILRASQFEYCLIANMAPCSNTHLSKHAIPCFIFWAFFLDRGVCGSTTKRMWFVDLCRLQGRSIWVSKCGCSCSYMCSSRCRFCS